MPLRLRVGWRLWHALISVSLAFAALSVFGSAIAQGPDRRDLCACDDANLGDFDLNPDVPDIVERWAPVIFQDVDERVDLLTSVNFDGNWLGADNAANAQRFPLPAVVYYSLVRTVTHTFLGYYFYHAESSDWYSGFFDLGRHEHDLEGIVAAVSRSTGQIEALLTNVHGPYVPYVAPWDFQRIQIKRQHKDGYRDQPDFTLLRRYPKSSGLPYSYDALAVGIEANTHAVWGRWHNKCVIGPAGSASGCDDSHGGDGVVYVYKNKAEVPDAVLAQFPRWREYGYALRDMKDLWHKAQDPRYCGQEESTALFACQQRNGQPGMPWDIFNSRGTDAGDLPWVWGGNSVIDHACDKEPNVLANPAEIFLQWFEFPAGTFSTTYADQPYVMSTPCP